MPDNRCAPLISILVLAGACGGAGAAQTPTPAEPAPQTALGAETPAPPAPADDATLELHGALAIDGMTTRLSPTSCVLHLVERGQHQPERQIPLREVDIRVLGPGDTGTQNAALEFVCRDGQECIFEASTSWTTGTPHEHSRDFGAIARTVIAVRAGSAAAVPDILRGLTDACDTAVGGE